MRLRANTYYTTYTCPPGAVAPNACGGHGLLPTRRYLFAGSSDGATWALRDNCHATEALNMKGLTWTLDTTRSN